MQKQNWSNQMRIELSGEDEGQVVHVYGWGDWDEKESFHFGKLIDNA